jgi:hypothetical protein
LKRLTITYGEHTLYDGPAAKLTWTETDNGVEVKADRPRGKPNLLQSLTQRNNSTGQPPVEPPEMPAPSLELNP